MMAQRFQAAKRRFGLTAKFSGLDASQFRVPAKAGDQRDLFNG